MSVRDRRGRPPAPVDRLVLAVLHTPVLHSMLDHSLCQLRYLARRSGRPVTLPVQYARHGADLVVYVGNAGDKMWWRNFTLPYSVDVAIRGAWYSGVGRIVTAGAPDRTAAREVYRGQHPRARIADADPFLLITLRPGGQRAT